MASDLKINRATLVEVPMFDTEFDKFIFVPLVGYERTSWASRKTRGHRSSGKFMKLYPLYTHQGRRIMFPN